MNSNHSGNVLDLQVQAGEYAGNCNCAFKAPTIPTCRDPKTHLDDCPAKGSGYPVGLVLARSVPHLTRLTTALEHWGRHFDWCAIKRSTELAFVRCDCGLIAEIEFARLYQIVYAFFDTRPTAPNAASQAAPPTPPGEEGR